jgi:imidazolonepropionase-like amidohydrolase/ketosteroid isomerase-like protein
MILLMALLAAPPDGPVKAFVGARLIDGTGRPAVEDAVLVVRDGRVLAVGPRAQMAVPPGAERVDLAGRTIMPGLVNAHGHVGETVGLRAAPELNTPENVARQLGLYARYGVTTVYSLGGDREGGFRARDEQDSPSLDRARVLVAGPVIGGATPEEGRRLVDELAPRKPDVVKIRVDDNLGTTPRMAPAVYQAVIAQAQKHRLRTAAHVYYLDDAKGVLRAGAGFIAHSVRDREVDEELVRLLKARDVCLSPTLMREVSTFVYESEPEFFADPFFLREADPALLGALRDPKRQQEVRASAAAQTYKKSLETASRNLKRLADAGVRIAMGTDTGPPARFQGYFEHLELELMAKAGLPPAQVLRAATGDAARCLGLAGKVGTLEPGAWADFLVLAKNPLEDVRNTRSLESVWIAGNRVPGPAPAGNAALREEVRQAEAAFARTMADRDHAAFVSFLADETVFFGPDRVLRGKAQVADGWKRYFAGEKAPFSWAPERVEVVDSGTLAMSQGPVFDPAGKRVGTFNSVWRREGDRWKIVLDNGCPPCDCGPTPRPSS